MTEARPTLDLRKLTDEQLQDKFNEIMDGLSYGGSFGWDWPTFRATFPNLWIEVAQLRAEARRRLRANGRFLNLEDVGVDLESKIEAATRDLCDQYRLSPGSVQREQVSTRIRNVMEGKLVRETRFYAGVRRLLAQRGWGDFPATD